MHSREKARTEVIVRQERLCDVWTERETDAALAWTASREWLRVTPHEVAHETALWRFPVAVDLLNVREGHVLIAKESTVDDQHLILEHRSEREPIEHFREKLHHRIVVLVLDFAFEAVDFVHVLGLVIAAEQVDMVREHQFHREERQHHFKRERTAIHKVSVE